MTRSSTHTKTLPCGKIIPTRQGLSASDREEIKTKLREYLQTHRLKITEQRWQIVDCILDHPGHWDSYEILKKVRGRFAKIGSATVYRTLKLLHDAGVLEALQVPGTQSVIKFELNSHGHHDHLLCNQCGEIFEFENKKIEELQSLIAKNLGFQEKEHRHVILGDCLLKTGSNS